MTCVELVVLAMVEMAVVGFAVLKDLVVTWAPRVEGLQGELIDYLT